MMQPITQNKIWSRIPHEGFWTSPRDSLDKCWGAQLLSCWDKCWLTKMNEKQVNRDNKAIANIKICFKVRATALRLRLHHREGFHYSLLRLPQRDLTTRNYKHSEYTTPQLNPLHKRQHKANWDNKLLVIKRSQTLSVTPRFPKYVETESRRESATYEREKNTQRTYSKPKVTWTSYIITIVNHYTAMSHINIHTWSHMKIKWNKHESNT